MAPNQPSPDRNRCVHCGNAIPSPRAGAEHATPLHADSAPSETEVDHALAQAQRVLWACMGQATRTGNTLLSRRCQELCVSLVTRREHLSCNLPEDGELACFLMDVSELGSELAGTDHHHGAEAQAVEMDHLARDLARLSLQLDLNFWGADPALFN